MRDSDRGIIRPAPGYLASLYIWTILIFGVFILPWILLGLAPEFGWTYVFIFLVVNVLWMIPTALLYPLYYRSIRYELREDEIVVHKGIITRSVRVVPYRTVTNLGLSRNPVDRLLGIGTVKVETAGTAGQNRPEAVLAGLADYNGVHEQVWAALRRYRAAMGPTTTEATTLPTAGMDAEILAELRDIKQILLRK